MKIYMPIIVPRRSRGPWLPQPSGRAGRWIKWLDGRFEVPNAEKQVREMITEWTGTDHQAAGQWLAAAAGSPARNVVASAYAEAVFARDPAAAVRWALAVPEGERRDATMKRLHDLWPENDAAGKEAFAGEHGIK